MRLFSGRPKNSYTIIVGCGRLGANLANTLSDENRDILIIDKKSDSFRKLSPSFGGMVVTGDATDMNVLRSAEIENATALIAVTNNDNTNILIAQLAKEMFSVDLVIARLYNPECESVYNELGIDTICPHLLSSSEIDKLLSKPVAVGQLL